MNRLFAAMVERSTPKYNPYIVNGLACYYIPFAQKWLDDIFQSASKSFPKGLTYEGCERCTPYEEYLEATRVRNNKRSFDLAESDLFLLKVRFAFQEEGCEKVLLPDRFLYLPFVNEAGIFRLGGTMYHITGVLSDKVISPGMNSVFVRLIRARLTFRHVGHSVMVDQHRETFNVVWSGIYSKPTKERSTPITTQAVSTVAHYLFAKEGFTKTFMKYAGFVPKFGIYQAGMERTPNTVLCRSSYLGTHSKPSTYMGFHYTPSNLYLEIPQEHWNHNTSVLVAGFFYIVDHFPDRFTPERLDSTFLWSVLLGHIIRSGVYSESKLYDDVREHFASIDDYLDIIVQDKLKEIGWQVNDFYDLIAKIMTDFPSLLLGNQLDANSMFNKNVEVLYYVLSELAFKVFKVNYQLRKSKSKKPLTLKMVTKAFNNIMTSRAIFHLRNDKMIVETVSYCGDHKYPKLTAKITEQESGSSKYRKKGKRVVLTENNHIHASMVEAGSVLFLSKSNPMPNSRLNPYVDIDLKTGTLIPKPEFKKLLEKLQQMLTRTTYGEVDEPDIDLEDEGDDEEAEIEVEMEDDLDLFSEQEADVDSDSD